MIGKRKLILVIEVALNYDKSLAWYTNKLIRRRKKKIVLAVISRTVVYRTVIIWKAFTLEMRKKLMPSDYLVPLKEPRIPHRVTLHLSW